MAYWNFNRYSKPRVGELLDKAAAVTNEAELTEIYRELNRIFMTDIPIIPLEYRPWEFYEYNETYWIGFPNEGNPVASPQHNFAGVKILYVIEPKVKK